MWYTISLSYIFNSSTKSLRHMLYQYITATHHPRNILPMMRNKQKLMETTLCKQTSGKFWNDIYFPVICLYFYLILHIWIHKLHFITQTQATLYTYFVDMYNHYVNVQIQRIFNIILCLHYTIPAITKNHTQLVKHTIFE